MNHDVSEKPSTPCLAGRHRDLSLKKQTWYATRQTSAQRDVKELQQANEVVVTNALELILKREAPMALGALAEEIHRQRGWGGTPPDELSRIIAADPRLQLTPQQTVVPGAVTGSRKEEVSAWNRRRLRHGLDTLKQTSEEDLLAALQILNLTGTDAEAITTTRRLARGDVQSGPEELARRLFEALVREPGASS